MLRRMRVVAQLMLAALILVGLLSLGERARAESVAAFSYDVPGRATSQAADDRGRTAPEQAVRDLAAYRTERTRGYDDTAKVARASARPVEYRLAPRMADDFVDLASPARRTHILQGDATGGGHLWPGAAGKTPFPRSWSADRIMHEISDIATDPIAWRNPLPQGSRTVLTGTRNGVDIRVIC